MSIYHYDDNSLNEVFKNKLVKVPLSSLLQLNKNPFKIIIIKDSLAAGLNRYQSVWTKYQEPLKTQIVI